MNKFSQKEQILFAKRLGFLMRAGIPIVDGLILIKTQIKNKNSQSVLEQIIAEVSNGQYLSSAMEKAGKVFGDFAINIIRVGESGGILADNLNYLAEELKKKQQLQKKVLGAMFYPAFIVTATFLLTFVLTVVVFPKVLPVFSSIGLKLPVSTKILIFISNALIHYWVWLLAFLICLGFIATYSYRQANFRILIERILLSLPILGEILKNYFLSNFCRTLGLLLKGETKLDEAIKITAHSTENLVYKNEFQLLALFVARGEKISLFLNQHQQLFPSMLGAMVSVGELSGNLSETFLYLAELYENEVDELTKNLSSLLEPVLMVFMGLLVGFVAISIITPIYSVTGRLNP